MLDELKQKANETRTENGAASLRSTGRDCLDFFATVGALRHAEEEEIYLRFLRAYAEDAEIAMKTLFFGRDVRCGLGERRVFRVVLRLLAYSNPASVVKNIAHVPEYGRYDDLLCLLGTPVEGEVTAFLKVQFDADMAALKNEGEKVSLLGKWLPSVNASGSETVRLARVLARAFGLTDAAYRRALTALRARIRIIENNLRERDYTFDYAVQPSLAMFKYRRAFMRNDGVRYGAYLERVREGREKINTAALEPYQIVDALIGDDVYEYFYNKEWTIPEEERVALDTMWRALPDYTTGENALVVADGSGSMYHMFGHSPASVAMSLAIYFAERNTGEFHNHFITFSETPALVEIKGRDITERVRYCTSFTEVANTNIEAVFRLILDTAVRHHMPKEQLPSRIYIVSDMEFDECASDADTTNFDNAKRMFEEAGYPLPQVVFWNVESRNMQQPARENERGVALVSGCTPRLFRMMQSGETTPYTQMMEMLGSERYCDIHA